MKRSLGLRLCRLMDSEKLSGAPELMSELNEAIDELDADDESDEGWFDHFFRFPVRTTLIIMAVAYIGAGTVEAVIMSAQTPHYKMPTKISKEEIANDRVVGVTTKNTSIMVEWDDPKQFTAKAQGAVLDAAGYTNYEKYHLRWPLSFISWGAHCVVHLPAGSKLEGEPQHPTSGLWVDPDNGNTLAHEILHCLRADWHWSPPGG